ncbi:MAG: hypothetical protein AAGA54_30395 [Myxococcota bacterium]
MMKMRERGWVIGLALGVMACGNAVDVTADTEGGSSSSSSGDVATTAGAATTDASTTGAPTTETTTAGEATTAPPTTDGDSTSGDDDGGFIMPETGADGGGEPGPNGAQCAGDMECESGFCYTIPTAGGVCSECLVDQDCETGTCSIDAVGYAICTDGAQGVQCNTDEGCMGDLVCTELIDTGGIFNASFCSECGPSAPCAGGQFCVPEYDLANFAGSFVCADAGAVENGQGCPLEGGNGVGEACASGFCGVASLMGFAELGVCGECIGDEDCLEPGQSCVGPELGMGGLVPAVCE